MKKHKILINADCSVNTINAQDRNGKHWALFLNARKYTIYLFNSGERDSRLYKPNIKIIKASVGRLQRIIRLLWTVLLGQFDVILNAKNGYDEYLLINMMSFLKRLRFKTKIITVAVNQVPYGETNSVYTKISDKILFNSNILLANSHRVSKTIFEYKGVNAPVLNNFYDLSLFIPNPHKNQRKKVLCHGSMIAVKQPFLFANIAKEIPEVDFIWIGERYYYKDMLEKAKNENINNLYLPGRLENNKLPEVLSGGDVYLYPSIHEGFPNVVVEAMASGLPVITFSRYGPEAVIDGVTGFIVDSEFEMLKRLRYLLANEKLILEFGKNARKRAEEYSGQKLAINLEEIIDNINRESENVR